MKRTLVLAGLVSLSAFSSASFVLTSHVSDANYDLLVGYAADVRTGNGSETNNTLATSGLLGLSDVRYDTGSYLNHFWSTMVKWDINSQYVVNGPVSSALGWGSIGKTLTQSEADGATSQVSAVNPGNVQRLYFSLQNAEDVRFVGSISQNGPLNRNNSGITIYLDNGSGYQIHTMKFVANTSFDDLLHLGAGNYMIESYAFSHANQNELAYASWNYTFGTVPEPATMIAIGSGVLAVLARRRKRN